MRIEFRRVRERDIDLLLLQQVCCSEPFLAWFFEQATGRKALRLKLLSATHSVPSSLGQTDVEITVSDGSGQKWAFLLEDKIARTKQPFQPERYRERFRFYPGHDCHVVLVAPERLSIGKFANGYSSVVALERVRDWIQNHEVESSTKVFKLALLQQALVPIPPRPLTDFWTNYWTVARQEPFKILNIRKPIARRGGSISFHPTHLPRGIRFVHRLVDGRVGGIGYVRIIFRGKRDVLGRLCEAVRSLTHNGYDVQAYGRTAAVISVRVPKLVKELAFDQQREAVWEGLSEAVSLWAWFCENRDAIIRAVA